MKFLLWLLAFALCAAAEPDLRRPIAEVSLKDGRTLKNVSIVSFASASVMAKWDGGRGTIAYDAFPDEWQLELNKQRPRQPTKAAQPPRVIPPPPGTPLRAISGQVFITTQGAGAYRFAGTIVRAYPIEIYDAAAAQQGKAEKLSDKIVAKYASNLLIASAWSTALRMYSAVAEAETDADGRFKILVPEGQEHFLFCFASRRTVSSEPETNVWAVKCSPAVSEINLNSGNEWHQPR